MNDRQALAIRLAAVTMWREGACWILLGALLGVLLFCSLAGAQMPVPRPEEEPTLSGGDSGSKIGEGAAGELVRMSIESKNRLGLLYLGADGQFVVGKTNTCGSPLEVIRRENGLLLRDSVHGDYAYVSPDGTMQKCNGEETVGVGAALPSGWRFKDKNGFLAMPSSDTALVPDDATEKQRRWRARKPRKCIGAVMLTAQGHFFILPDDMKPFKNIMWVVRRQDGGLDFIHSGPKRSGTFMQISPGCVVTWPNREDAPADSKGKTIRWPFITQEDKLPILPTWREIVLKDFQAHGLTIVDSEGRIITEGPVVP